MSQESPNTYRLLIVVTPNFNLLATTGFIDPMRAANYLQGKANFAWTFASTEGGPVTASNGLTIETRPISEQAGQHFDMVVVSSSWSPEKHASANLLIALRKWGRAGSTFVALDTGAFILADAGMLDGKRATTHYEHIDSLKELYSEVEVTEDLFVLAPQRFTCCGGSAAIDLGLRIVGDRCGDDVANAAARYIFHPTMRPAGAPQNPSAIEPLGHTAPIVLRQIIAEMEKHLEEPLSIPQLCARVGMSQRQVNRLFTRFVARSPILYYRDIRLDRARGLVTQTDLQMSEIAAASGFVSQAHFSKAYRERFGITPREDRSEGRIPFEFRAWPMYRKQG